MKKLLIFSAMCASLLLSSCDEKIKKALDTAGKVLHEINEMTQLADELGVKVPDEVKSLIATAEKRKEDADLALIYLDQAKLTLELALQKNENEGIEDSVKVVQESLDKYRKKHNSRANSRANSRPKTKEAP